VNVRGIAGRGAYRAGMALLGRPMAGETFGLLVAAGENAHHAAVLLQELLRTYPEHASLAADLKEVERAGDALTHDLICRLRRGPGLPAVGAADGHALATAIDDIVDHAEQAGDWLGLYAVEAPMEQADELADVLVAATDRVVSALGALREGSDLAPIVRAIASLEDEGDRVYRGAVASLFARGIDPMVVIRWKDIFESLEAAVDACEHVAHVLEGISLQQGG
jgi:uncharacterized protein